MTKNAVVPFDQMQVPAHIATAFAGKKNDDIYRVGGVPSVSFRGKVWRYTLAGEEVDVVDGEGTVQPTIEVVLLKANATPSKAFYKGAYVEGSSAPPDCASGDGVTPDAYVKSPVATSCAICPNNVLGSRITEEGKKAKACSDKKRVAVTPASLDMPPLLLAMPPTSTWDRDNAANEAKGWFALSQYGDFLNKKGVHYSAVVTRIGFDSRKAFPKLLFKAVRFLTPDELAKVTALQESKEVHDVLQSAVVLPAAVEGEPAPAPVAAQVVQMPKPAAPKAPKPTPEDSGDDLPPGSAAAPPAPAKPAAPKATKTVVVQDDELADELKTILGGLDD